MKVAISSEQRRFFQKNQAVELEEYLSKENLLQLNKLVDEVLAVRLSCEAEKLSKVNPEKLFLAGRDLWREKEELQKRICYPGWAEVASQLTEQTPVRIGYDQLFFSRPALLTAPDVHDAYRNLLWKPGTLEEISCFRGLLCGLMICLQNDQPASEPIETISIFPQNAGNAVYFSPSASIDFSPLWKRKGERYLLIAYAQAKATYIIQPKDPLTHLMKQYGYVVGDYLKEKLNPTLFR